MLSETEISSACRVLEAAEATGAVRFKGEMVDRPVIERARDIGANLWLGSAGIGPVFASPGPALVDRRALESRGAPAMSLVDDPAGAPVRRLWASAPMDLREACQSTVTPVLEESGRYAST